VLLGRYDSLELHNNKEPQGRLRDLARRILGERIFSITSYSHFGRKHRRGIADVKLLDGTFNRTYVSVLTPLAGLQQLKELQLDGLPIRNLTPLAGLRQLEKLSFTNSFVSDLTPLSGLKNLKALTVGSMFCSDEQVDSLQKALPNCKVRVIGLW
jgi:Leucine-rich repeat (LRR) protein